MKLGDIGNIRLNNQQVAGTKFKTVKDLVGWMGAIQAQDYGMAKWAIGVRLPGSTEQDIERAISKGEIIRTHILRPTWHFVSSDDIYWMLELTSSRIKASLRSRSKELELTETIYKKSNKILESVLSGGNSSTREELISVLGEAKIPTNNNRASYIFLHAELDGLICSGASKNKKQTYALLQERVPKTRALTREEALAKLAIIYITSHGPATLRDFTWWSGLSPGDSRAALESVQSKFDFETIGAEIYWFANTHPGLAVERAGLFLLPAFDEFIISYRDRSASLISGDLKKTISQNGMFRPVIVINGKVTGLWKRTTEKDKVVVKMDLFQPHSIPALGRIKKKAEALGNFLGKRSEITWERD